MVYSSTMFTTIFPLLPTAACHCENADRLHENRDRLCLTGPCIPAPKTLLGTWSALH